MKRLRSSDDLESNGEKGVSKDWGRKEEDSGSHRPSSHRSFSHKSESGRKGVSSSSSRYDRVEDDRESSRSVKKRPDYDVDSYDRRKSYDRYRDSNERVVLSSSSPRSGQGVDRIHRSESFSLPRRDFPKGFRSERDRSRREGSVSSWRRFGGGKDGDEGTRGGLESLKVSRTESVDVSKVKSPQVLRDAKSPPWSKDSGSESLKVGRTESGDASKLKSRQVLRDAKSPPWSKDSGSEQSKSVECKKNENTTLESGADSSEMEEGELEPDRHPVTATEPVSQKQASVGDEHQAESKLLEDKKDSLSVEEVAYKEEQAEGGLSENVIEVETEVEEFPDTQNPSIQEKSDSGKDIVSATADNEDGKDNEYDKEPSYCVERADDTYPEKPSASKAEPRGNRDRDVENKENGVDLTVLNKGLVGKTVAPVTAVSAPAAEEITQSFKDKGKSLAIPHSNGRTPLEDMMTVKTEQRSVAGLQDAHIEQPCTRGFELFASDPVKKAEKAEHLIRDRANDGKLALDLSLSLPNVLMPIGSNSKVQAPGSPSHARSSSFQSSFRTNSDGFTTSFSGSQNFTHNPSCSLTHNSFDNYEKSVGSRPIFQGVDWQALSSEEHKSKEGPAFQSMFSNGNGLHQMSQASRVNSGGQLRVVDGSSRVPVAMERQLSYGKHLSGAQSWHPNDVRSPTQSAGSHETRSEYTKDKKRLIRENNGGTLYRMSSSDGKEQSFSVGADFAESIITMLVSEPLSLMAHRFSEMTEHQVKYVKESVRDIILNPGKQWQLIALQKALRNRTDITLEMLLKSHRAQLEILASLKTGLQEFLQQNFEIASSDFAEIFLNLRCRNLSCRSLLPVDECDCKICTQKNGFCSACMCLVCAKFDMASNTCSWVGCDVCLHWCHADCGIQKSYIRNGRSVTGAEGTEMQFHCVACNHPSEMFGFVKEVFQNFAKEWTAGTLSKELEYVRRIFSGSEDVRGKLLHEIAIKMVSRLGDNADLQQVQNHIMGFLADAESFRSGNTPTISRQEASPRYHDGSIGVAGSSQGTEWLKSIHSDKPTQSEKSASLFPNFEFNMNEKYGYRMKLEIQTGGQQEPPVFDELDSLIRIKHAEAKMFQARADDARKEAEALKRIATSKNERNEEEYTSRIAKLRLTEAEDIRKQKLEELQGVERAYHEYFGMKMRMETDIKDLLLKMEATRRNLSM